MRPDFGSRPARARVRAEQRDARGGDAVPGAGRAAAAAGDLIAVRRSTVEPSTPRCRSPSATPCWPTAARSRPSFAVPRRRRRMKLLLLRPAPAARCQGRGSANAHRVPRGARPLEPVQALRQRTLFVRLLRPGFTLTPDNVLHRRRRARPGRCRSNGCAAADDLPPAPTPALVDGIDDLPRTSSCAPRAATSRATRCASSPAPAATSRRPASTRCCRDRFLVQGRVPVGLRLRRARRRARRSAGDAGDRLPREGLRRLPPADARPAEPAGAGLERALCRRCRRRAGRAAGVRGGQPVYRQDAIANEAYLGTARQRVSVRRHARLVDYALHEAATRAPGCTSRSAARRHRCRSGHAAADRAPATCRRQLAPDSNGDCATRSPPARWCSRRRTTTTCSPTSTSCRSTPGATRAAACRAARRARRCAAQHPDLQAGDVAGLRGGREPDDGEAEDADAAQRWAVRLTAVSAGVDPPASCSTSRRSTAP